MISDEETTTWENQNKIYIPSNYVNNNYKYTISGDEITIITNNNCYNNYNTTYCDCYRYNEKYNIITESYSCNSNPNNYILNNNNISDNINYSSRITGDYVNQYIIWYGILIIVLLFIGTMKRSSIKI